MKVEIIITIFYEIHHLRGFLIWKLMRWKIIASDINASRQQPPFSGTEMTKRWKCQELEVSFSQKGIFVSPLAACGLKFILKVAKWSPSEEY